MTSSEFNNEKRAKKKMDHSDKSLWKQEYEEELTDAMLSGKKRKNSTRTVQSLPLSDNEVVVEKLMETITSSEKYLKKIDNIDFRLNRLDIEVHEKTNVILKKLSELAKVLREQAVADKPQVLLEALKTDTAHIKFMLEKNPRFSDTGNRWLSIFNVLKIIFKPTIMSLYNILER